MIETVTQVIETITQVILTSFLIVSALAIVLVPFIAMCLVLRGY